MRIIVPRLVIGFVIFSYEFRVPRNTASLWALNDQIWGSKTDLPPSKSEWRRSKHSGESLSISSKSTTTHGFCISCIHSAGWRDVSPALSCGEKNISDGSIFAHWTRIISRFVTHATNLTISVFPSPGGHSRISIPFPVSFWIIIPSESFLISAFSSSSR